LIADGGRAAFEVDVYPSVGVLPGCFGQGIFFGGGCLAGEGQEEGWQADEKQEF